MKTSRDKIFWERDAHYEYYRHGPLARTILGQQQVQGLDYAYTLQGWLKGVNSTSVGDGNWDMGNDGKTTGWNNIIARDAYGFSLNYFNNDYDQIGSTNPFAATTIANELFNGNISAMMVNLPKLGEALKYGYKYDQLNRLTAMDAWKGLNNAMNVLTPLAINDYKEKVSYDPNGNILTYKRNGDAARSVTNSGGMDNLTYTYKPNKNQLSSVLDSAPDATSDYARYNDIRKDKTYNYEYDSIGNLISDAGEDITIEWNVYGKIKSIAKTGVDISYTYDASGNRISKKVNNQYTYYVRDAQGNVMSIYEYEDTLKQKEIMLYGSSRLGTFKVDKNVQNCVTPPIGETITFTRGNKLFELSNHLGNVLAIISDKRMQHSANGTTVDYYKADVISANDYYPFGMMMAGRKYSVANTRYRYGFNGKELDREVSATTTYDYGFRIYSPALGKFLSMDPLFKNFPWWTPYQFAGNTPIQAIDLDGLEILLPQTMPIPIEPILTIPRVPTIPISAPPGEILLPPVVPNLPNSMTVGQPKSNSIDKLEGFDWSKVDRSKPETWPEPPFSGERKVGEPSRQKPKERGEKSWYDEQGGEWRPHIPDNHHKEGHWDYKPLGKNTQWQDIYLKSLLEIIIEPKPKQENFLKKIWKGIKDFFTPEPPKPQDNPYFT